MVCVLVCGFTFVCAGVCMMLVFVSVFVYGCVNHVFVCLCVLLVICCVVLYNMSFVFAFLLCVCDCVCFGVVVCFVCDTVFDDMWIVLYYYYVGCVCVCLFNVFVCFV